MADQATIDRLWRAIDERRDELIGITADLVRIPSLLGDEAPVQRYVADQLRRAGMETESWDLDDSVLTMANAGNSGMPFPGRPNVTARRPGSGGGRSLVLNGHIDVVSPEPVSGWSYDPWGAEIVGDRMYGRGAYDMKSGIGLNIFLARLLHDLGIRLQGNLAVHSVIEEECTGNGALAASLRDPADACIVTEPSGGSWYRAHLGVIWFRVRIEGVSAHAGHAWQGVNAIVKSVPVIEALRILNEDLNAQVHPVWEGLTHPINLNVGVIQGGDWPSTVPGACELRCRTSFFPGTSVAEMRARIESTIAAAAEQDEWLREHPPVVTYDGFSTNGVMIDPSEPFIRVLGDAHLAVNGSEMPEYVATAVTDQRYYAFNGIPATCYGASGGNAHAVDEWLDLTSMAPAAKVLAKFIVDWCGVVD